MKLGIKTVKLKFESRIVFIDYGAFCKRSPPVVIQSSLKKTFIDPPSPQIWLSLSAIVISDTVVDCSHLPNHYTFLNGTFFKLIFTSNI